MTTEVDVLIVGGGIVGLATAYRLTERHPARRLLVLEKEAELAHHQTGHNSGVLHSGIYYRPGSLKAKNCRLGKRALEEFCTTEGVPFEITGKVIVAVSDDELGRLDQIVERGRANGVRCELIGPERLRELEPYAAGLKAIHVPEAGIVDFRKVCERLAARVTERGGQIRTGAKVTQFESLGDGIVVRSSAGEFRAKHVVNCAGLHCDRIAELAGAKPSVKIVPFRGEYWALRPEAHRLCNNLIYPVPDPSFPFLGVHFTRKLSGGIEAGPNAVLALAREGYSWGVVKPKELLGSLAYPGMLRLARTHWRYGIGEMHRSLSRAAMVRQIQRLLPDVRADDLHPAGAGVRAQAVRADGTLVDDFLFVAQGAGAGAVLHVLNAPSPAATAALPIGREILETLTGEKLGPL